MAADGIVFFEEVEAPKRRVFLRGVTAPHGGIRKDPAFFMGGTLRTHRSYEPGVTQPVRHITGTAESDWAFSGHLRDGQIGEFGGAARLQQLIDDIRLRGRELRIVWGVEARRGFLVETKFGIEGASDRTYEIRFEIDAQDKHHLAQFARRAATVPHVGDMSNEIESSRHALLSIPGLSFGVVSAISDLYAGVTRPLGDLIGALGDVEAEAGDVKDAWRRVANSAGAFLDRLEHLAGTLDSYDASALDLDDGAAIVAWHRARIDALVQLQEAAARAWDVGADAERRASGTPERIYVAADGDTVEQIAAREGTTPEAIWALNPSLPFAPAVGTRVRLP